MKYKYYKGITLVSLVIIIVILLILSSITMVLIIGNDGIISRANTAKIEMLESKYKEEVGLIIEDAKIEIYSNINKSFKELVIEKIKEKSWFSKFIDLNENENENEIIILTKDKFKIKIEFIEDDASIIYVIYNSSELDNQNPEEGDTSLIKEELPYLRATGNQYIDTEYVANQDTSIEIQFQLLSRKSQFIYGVRKNTNDKTYSLCYGKMNSGVECFRSDYNTTQKNLTINENDVQTIKQEQNNIYVNGKLESSHLYNQFIAGSNSTEKNNNLFLLNVNTDGNIENSSYGADIKLFYCKIWDNNKLIRDFIPIIDRNDIVCLYDKIQNKTYYAKHIDKEEEFERNSEFTELKSIISDGKQYIDTELKPNGNTSIEIKARIDGQSFSQGIFGARTDVKTKSFCTFFVKENQSIRCDYNSNQTNIGVISSDVNTIKQDKNTFYINNVKKSQTTYNDFNCDYNMYLFAINTANTVTLKSYLDFYYSKIWNGNNLVRDYIPILDENNVICLYDRLNKKKYYSKEAVFLLGGVSY